eukprot:6194475-Pleurochrysis_carterae.AAC.1
MREHTRTHVKQRLSTRQPTGLRSPLTWSASSASSGSRSPRRWRLPAAREGDRGGEQAGERRQGVDSGREKREGAEGRRASERRR